MSSSHVPDHVEVPPPTIEEMSRGIDAYIQLDGSWFLHNAGFVVGESGVAAVDTVGTEKRARAFHAALRTTTDKPVQVLVNTHSHADHTHGNFMFAPNTAIIAHELCREDVLRSNVELLRPLFPSADFGHVPAVAPFVTFEDRMNVFVDDLRIELLFAGPAHTTNDVIAWIPDRKVLFAGDLVFNGGTPFAMAGSIGGWLKSLDTLRALGATTIVPGHGTVCGPDVFDTIEAYLRFIQDVAKAGHAKGAPPLELAQATDLGRFAGLSDPERIVGNLYRAYSELDGKPWGNAIDVGASFAGMVAYNGGQPLRCLA
jgi:cyclase